MASGVTLLVQNKLPRFYIKSKREEEVRENDVVMKYEFYQDEIRWLKAVNKLIQFQNIIERDAKGGEFSYL